MRILIFIIFLTWTINAHAFDDDVHKSPTTSYKIISYGAAVLACKYWKQQNIKGVRIDLALDGYMAGFLTSYNVYNSGNKDVLGGLPMEDVKKYLNLFCEKYPLNNILSGLILMVDDLEAQRVAVGLMVK